MKTADARRFGGVFYVYEAAIWDRNSTQIFPAGNAENFKRHKRKGVTHGWHSNIWQRPNGA